MRYIALAVVSFLLGYVTHKQIAKERNPDVDVNSVLERSIEQVSKLVVTEAHYSQIFTRKNADSYLWDLIRLEKKAVILGMVDADVSYDLSQLKYRVDQNNKTIILQRLPPADVGYHYNFKWYDLEQSRLNQFSQQDLNKIQADAKKAVQQKIDERALISQGDQRLIEELERIWSGLIAIGWSIDNQSAQMAAPSSAH